MGGALTVSEHLFEDFLRLHALPFERIPEAEEHRPDYLVSVDKLRLVFEVKEISTDANFGRGELAVSSRTVGEHVRPKIQQARKQVRYGASLGLPTVLLIYNALDPLHRFGTEDHDFEHAMYGERTLVVDVATTRVTDDYHGRNKSFSPTAKTYFSALRRLKPTVNGPSVTLFENLHAALPLPYAILPACFDVVRSEIANSDPLAENRVAGPVPRG